MQEAVTAKNWKIRGPAILRMKSLSNGSTLQNATSAIDSAMSEAGVGDGETIGQYLENLMRDEVQKMDLDEQVEQMIVDRCLEKDNAPSLVQIKKIAPKENYEAISNFVKSSPVLLKKFIVPIEDSIHLFAIEALRGIHSTLISDSDSEVARLRSEVSKAIDAITSSGDEVAMEIIKRQMQKLKSLDNIASAMEGIVFIYNGNAYKFTASFAPVNQILGLFKYGRGSTKL
jgi:hypothetical protein